MEVENAVGYCFCRKMQNIFFYRKMHNFEMVIIVSKLLISVTKGFQPNIERLKMCFSNTFHVSDPLQ